MNNITSQQYWTEVSAIAANLVSESADYTDCNTADTFDRDTILDHINDSALHETIDGHQWVIYYAYNLDIYKHSDNSDSAIDDFGDEWAGELLRSSGLSGLHQGLAFWAFYRDVQEALDSALDDYEQALPEKHQEASDNE